MELNMTQLTRTDDASASPRLDIQMSWWTMNRLGDGTREWSTEEKFHHIAEAGYNGINGFVPAPEAADKWIKLLERYGLSFSVNAYPKSASDMNDFLKKVKSYGGPIQFVNAQVLTPFVIGRPAEKLLTDMDELSRDSGIPVYIETHRGTITQDLLRTVEYVNHLDFLRLTIDYSHYVVAGEMHTVNEEAERLLQALLPRTASIHARVSNGEQIQVDVGEKGEHPMTAHFLRWWRCGMSHWLKSAKQGDVFPFVCELGPPPYAITTDEHVGRSKEFSDRWKQSMLFANMAREIWKLL